MSLKRTPAVLLLDARLAQVYPLSCMIQTALARADGSSSSAANMSENDFIRHEQLGAGKFGVAFRATHVASGAICVLKEVSKASILEEAVLPQLRREVR